MIADRPAWINKVFDQFLEDFRADRDPTVSLKAAINDLERGRIDPELLKIKVKLGKDPEDYPLTILIRKSESCLEQKLTTTSYGISRQMGTKRKKAGVSINPREMLSGEELKQEMESSNKSQNSYWTW
jgi:hypothetical protein